ncbi:MAG: FAD-dependent oxidoreductase [Actinomycetes bacterium]
MAKILIVGGGIIGTMHAYLALEAGHQVVQCEKDPQAQSASVRNFGLVWVSGRAKGAELELALRSRELWEKIGTTVGTIGFRANGSLTIAANEEELQIIGEASEMTDAKARGFEFLTADETKKLEPLLAGNYLGALRCTKDAAIEPNLLFSGLRKYLLDNPNYEWLPNFEVMDLSSTETGHHLRNITGKKISGDLLVICAGAYHNGFLSEHMQGAAVRRVRLQMAATEPIAAKLGHSVADGDSMRYYPAFRELSINKLPPQSALASELRMQLLLAPRLDGSFTIGDTHEYVEPFGHELLEEPYDHLQKVISSIFGAQGPKIARRWDGIYSESTGPAIYFRKEIEAGVTVVTGGGGRGNTLAPAIAEESFKLWA